jgi:hypothetical protein
MSLRSILNSTAFVLVGILVGAAGAQVLPITQYINTGLFTIGQREAFNFHVSLDDAPEGLPAGVLMRVFDRSGRIVRHDDVILHAGESKTMRVSTPGTYRVHAQVADSSQSQSSRRTLVSSVEVFDVDDLTIDRNICPQIHDEPNTGGRP